MRSRRSATRAAGPPTGSSAVRPSVRRQRRSVARAEPMPRLIDGLEVEVAQVRDLDITELRKRWQKLYGRPAPKTFRRNLLIRGVAYQMHVAVHGGLSAATKRRLREIAEAVRAGNEDAVLPGPRIKPGTRLYRAWRDKTHVV